MCTVTFIPRATGYYLAMNRDEKLSRVAGLPPTQQRIGGRSVLFPSEPEGGTWIALNDSGSCFALVNWYSVTARVAGETVSRGEVIKSVSALSNRQAVEAKLNELPLDRINPFRFIGVFPTDREIFEWRWDLNALARKTHPWKAQQWISSGLDEATAQQSRGNTFWEAQWDASSGTLDWLRRLHRSHSPHRGAFSTCVHRVDAKTVSYTEVSVSSREGRMRYCAKSPCEHAGSDVFDFDERIGLQDTHGCDFIQACLPDELSLNSSAVD